jgi:hypothetical protein
MEGAWAILILVPVLVWLLVRMNKQYTRETEELERDLAAYAPPASRSPIAVLLVDDLDPKTVHALQYTRTIRANRTIAVHVEEEPARTAELERAWREAGLGDVPLRVLRGGGDPTMLLSGFLGAYERDDRDVIFIVPVPHEQTRREHLAARRSVSKLTRALLTHQHVRVTMVRDHPEGVHPLQRAPDGRPTVRLAARGVHEVVILVDKLDRATLEAITYGLELGATSVRAVHAASDPDRAGRLAQRWLEL